VPAAVRFLSCEPLIGPLELDLEGIHWVIVGGESGVGHRPIKAEWVRSIREQCRAAGVAFFFKQWGEWKEVDGPRCRKLNQEAARQGVWMLPDGTVIPRTPDSNRDHSPYGTSIMARLGKHRTGRELDGRTWDEFPQTEAVYAR
jgi:protein gp37